MNLHVHVLLRLSESGVFRFTAGQVSGDHRIPVISGRSAVETPTALLLVCDWSGRQFRVRARIDRHAHGIGPLVRPAPLVRPLFRPGYYLKRHRWSIDAVSATSMEH
jgi:hypothetical protein